MLLKRALERGLTVASFEDMTVGMIIDFLIYARNEEVEAEEVKKKGRVATAEDYDSF